MLVFLSQIYIYRREVCRDLFFMQNLYVPPINCTSENHQKSYDPPPLIAIPQPNKNSPS